MSLILLIFRDGEYSADREGSYYRDDPYNRPADEYPQRDRDESSRRRSEEYYPRDEARSRRRDPYEDDIASYRPRDVYFTQKNRP